MSRSKLRKSKQKRKNKKEDKSEIVSCVEEECVGATCEEFSSQPCVCERKPRKQKCSKSTAKQVHFSVLPDRYEPLEEDTASDTGTEQSRRGKAHTHKSFRKNFGKALRFTWKCLIVGLQSFSTSYSGPLSAASTLVPEMQRTAPKA